jgi:cardiolipin synthase A/B
VAVRLLPGNRLTLLRAGMEYFPALESAIGEARTEVFLETYIYAGDAVGRRITRALCDAASRGVAVRVLVDGFGAKDMPAKFVKELREAGARLLVFRPEIFPFPWRRERLRRMHRKLAVIDDRVAFVGGINVIDDADTPGQPPPRFDFAAKVEGPLVGVVRTEAARLWNRVALARLDPDWRVKAWSGSPPVHRGDQRAGLVVRDNFRHRRSIENAYLAAMRSATREIVLANAYFLPGRRFRRVLIAAAQRGVRVALLLQGHEYPLLHDATRALYGTLLAAGVEIREYRRSFLHAKVAVIDGHWATVGSSNIDPFSLLLAREANVVVEGRRFAAELRAALQAAMGQGSLVIEKTQWLHQPLWRRLRIWLAYGLARLALGVVGLGREF